MTDESTSREVRPDYPAALAWTRQGLRSAAGAAPILLPALTRFGGTNFENHELDDMLDMIESARPSDLELTGDALVTAAEAIRGVGEELKKYADQAEWEGESGDAMRKWTANLSKNTLKLATYSETAGKQLKNAGEGLATVKKSMPKRDADGGLAEAVKDIPTPARVDTNPDYAKAKKREGDRQEAITQMNKLSSYYIVSHDTMATQEEPVFTPMPDVGVPAPVPTWNPIESGPTGSAEHTVTPTAGGAAHHAAVDHRSAPQLPTAHHQSFTPADEARVGIDSVAPPAPPADPTTRVPTQPPGPTNPPVAPGPLPTGPVSTGPIPRGTGKLPGVPGPLRPGGQPPGLTGRGTTGPVSPLRPGTTGRPGPMGQPGTPGRPSGVSPRAIGRPAVTGTGPAVNGARPGAAGMPRGRNGIVGGTPSTPGRTTASSPSARAITPGGERGATTGRGIVGAGAKPSAESAEARAASARRLATNQGGVVGTPRSESGAPGRGQRGFTQGGTGLVRNTGGEEHPAGAPRGESQKENRRPGQPTEDEETWNTGRRRDTAPPVIE
ncbi:hypothetical protein [Streptomyces sp. NPDC053542]|uniref:hypothetical protein n=1 Tax=Streptomyces sp. NPDC053542 TaxID=3365710 RepID=UPI0037D0C0B3